ncbi:ABC transporter substrate-binding protein [Bacteroides sedimenti]|uniref:Thiamine biosynthesis protein n=1 Tax=Bacteroides sedimenti TaxID=2136147 RepID=A0ABM8IFH4_9BACE
MKRHFISITLILTVLLFASCKGKEKIADHIELQQLTLGIIPSMDYIPFAVAQKQGIYDSLGLSVDFVKFQSASDRDNAFKTGKLDGAITDLTHAIFLQANGAGLKIIMKTDGALYLLTGKESGIRKLSDLKLTNIGVSENTAAEFFTDITLQSANILTENVNKPKINKIPVRLEMLQNGQIDASFFPEPFATVARNNGMKTLITSKELGINVSGTIFSEKAIQEKSEEITALVQGYNLGVEFIKTHPAKEWIKILAEDSELPESAVKHVHSTDFQKAELPEAKDLKANISWLKAKQLIKNNFTGENLVDSTFVK